MSGFQAKLRKSHRPVLGNKHFTVNKTDAEEVRVFADPHFRLQNTETKLTQTKIQTIVGLTASSAIKKAKSLKVNSKKKEHSHAYY